MLDLHFKEPLEKLKLLYCKDYGDFFKVQSLGTDLANMDANPLNYWLSKFFQEVANSEGKVYPARIFYGIICGIRRYLEETVGSEA